MGIGSSSISPCDTSFLPPLRPRMHILSPCFPWSYMMQMPDLSSLACALPSAWSHSPPLPLLHTCQTCRHSILATLFTGMLTQVRHFSLSQHSDSHAHARWLVQGGCQLTGTHIGYTRHARAHTMGHSNSAATGLARSQAVDLLVFYQCA